jgi:hypothetical protein
MIEISQSAKKLLLKQNKSKDKQSRSQTRLPVITDTIQHLHE